MKHPGFSENGDLAEGEHQATLDEVEAAFGQANEQRKFLMQGLRDAIKNLKAAGVKRIWIDGSFVADKDEPNDIDGCWEYSETVDHNAIDPVFLESREASKKKYGLDFFISHIIEAESGLPFPKFFQVNRDGEAKGIIVVNLGQ